MNELIKDVQKKVKNKKRPQPLFYAHCFDK